MQDFSQIFNFLDYHIIQLVGFFIDSHVVDFISIDDFWTFDVVWTFGEIFFLCLI